MARGGAGCKGKVKGKEDSSFSEEKEAKRLLSVCLRGPIPTIRIGPRTPICKGFLLLFFKKEVLSS
jgi:hypothetical protein